MIFDNYTKMPISCQKFSDSDYSRYVKFLMTGPELCEFESHVATCSECRHCIREATVAIMQQKEREENKLLQDQSLTLMDRFDRDIFTVVLRAMKGMVELVRSTGEQLVLATALAEVRSSSSNNDGDTALTLRLVKEFDESKISVEVTISPVEPDMLNLVVSLLDRNSETFLPGVSISCCGEYDFKLEEITDDDGLAFFTIAAAGYYELVMTKNGRSLGAMSITGL